VVSSECELESDHGDLREELEDEVPGPEVGGELEEEEDERQIVDDVPIGREGVAEIFGDAGSADPFCSDERIAAAEIRPDPDENVAAETGHVTAAERPRGRETEVTEKARGRETEVTERSLGRKAEVTEKPRGRETEVTERPRGRSKLEDSIELVRPPADDDCRSKEAFDRARSCSPNRDRFDESAFCPENNYQQNFIIKLCMGKTESFQYKSR
jgi:hypothetical protein